MAQISTADFRNGMCIEYNGKLCTIVEFQHVKPGKGSAFVRTKLKDIRTGRVVDSTTMALIIISWTMTPMSRCQCQKKPLARQPNG